MSMSNLIRVDEVLAPRIVVVRSGSECPHSVPWLSLDFIHRLARDTGDDNLHYEETRSFVYTHINRLMAVGLADLFRSRASAIEVLSRSHDHFHKPWEESFARIAATDHWVMAVGTNSGDLPIFTADDCVVSDDDWDASPVAVLCSGKLTNECRAEILGIGRGIRESWMRWRLIEDLASKFQEVDAVCAWYDRQGEIKFSAKSLAAAQGYAQAFADTILSSYCPRNSE
jgi:hypothetical protein